MTAARDNKLSRSLRPRQDSAVASDATTQKYGRWYRPLALGLTVLLLVGAGAVWLARWSAFSGLVGIDYQTFMAFGQRWLDTGSMYLAYQTAGPFDPQPLPHVPELMPSMYPPLAGPVFAAWTFIPTVLWWAIPLGVVGYAIWRLRPVPWTWPILALALAWPTTSASIIVGNTTMWVVAGIAGGILWGWPALVILAKPTFLPLALVGVRHRSWWIGLAVIAGISLLMLPEWVRYVEVIRNAESAGLLYSIGDLPLVLVPIVAWLGTYPLMIRSAAQSRDALAVRG